jgi:divalent metal cation (Fe/Co/Zn/Cd) transporter
MKITLLRSIKGLSVGQLLQAAWVLSMVTVVYNVFEGVISMLLGSSDEALSLLGFGADSFVEVISGIGVAHMVWRMQRNNYAERSRFETQALKITGFSFYGLAAALVLGAANSIYYGLMPESTVPGVIISIVSIASMYLLYRYKMAVGKALGSQPIISDAHCTKTCFYLSFILLAASLLYALFKIPYVDAAGSVAIGWYAFKEGREALGKARGEACSCCND